MLAVDSSLVDEQKAVLDSVYSARLIRCEWWQLRVKVAKRNRVF